jgi:hypothetical protein
VSSPPSRGAPVEDESVVLLPGGYVDNNGTLHREVELAEVTGDVEYFVANLSEKSHTASRVTAILSKCIRRIGSRSETGEVGVPLARGLLTGDRDYLMLKLREKTLGTKVACVLRCPDQACGQPMDLIFDTSAFEFARAPVTRAFFEARFTSGAEGVDVEFRLPTGDDQEALAELFTSDQSAAANELLVRCLRRVGSLSPVDPSVVASLSEKARSQLEDEMGRLAPRVEIELESQCPECKRAFETPFDLTSYFFDELKTTTGVLEREVHFLAWHYHWSERDILSMTRKKRRRYVALLQKEMDRSNRLW